MTHLCVPIIEPTAQAALERMRELPRYVGLVEVRLDYIWKARPNAAGAAVDALCLGKDRPIIVTLRPEREGGLCGAPEGQRMELLRRAARAGADFIDVELDSVAALGEVGGKTRRIVSQHDFSGTPGDLESLHRRALQAGADVVKIAVRARDITDCFPVIELLKRHAGAVPTIALSMEEEGLITRVLAPKFGAFLSFASMAEGKGSAPGQVSFREMEELYRFSSINPSTPLYGVVANPVAHSMSPAIHNAAFAALGLDGVYLPLKVTDPARFLKGFERYDLRGLSVTIPHKGAMAALMDELDDLSASVGAVNTVSYRDGRRLGSNTDVAAALQTLEGACRRAGLLPMAGRTVLLLGAGGAGRAMAHALTGLAGRLVIANRTVERAERLCEELGAECCGLDEIQGLAPDIVINTTSVGMHPHVDASPVPASMLRRGMVVFDAVYNPIETLLLREAREAECVTVAGFEWFVRQAATQFETWTGHPAPRERMAEVVRERLTAG